VQIYIPIKLMNIHTMQLRFVPCMKVVVENNSYSYMVTVISMSEVIVLLSITRRVLRLRDISVTLRNLLSSHLPFPDPNLSCSTIKRERDDRPIS